MRDEKVILELDRYEEGAIIRALNDMRNKEIAEQNPTDSLNELLLKIIRAPAKKARIRDEAR
ncbi:MAG: hypothetical protein LBK56_02525 [Gracilibacteraceae bacterium]|jgi:hypothetical protein|nr:hypothetical protein [Gracilibacteraceae bacterium]